MEKVKTSSRIPEFDVVRVLAMFWVVTYHFGCEYSLPLAGSAAPLLNFFCVTPNFDFGNVAVTLFLVLSGALLYRKYGNGGVSGAKGGLRKFYVSRARTIYPAFWIVNLYVVLSMARHWVSGGTPFFAGNPLKLLLTVTGFDGYVRMFGFENYYFCGEWFIGAIVFLYAMFPLLLWGYRKSATVLLVFLTLGYGLQFFLPSEWISLLSILPCTLMLKFVLGFVLMDSLPKLKKPAVGALSLVVFAILCLVDIPGPLNQDFLGSLAAFLVFFAVMWLGGSATRSAPVQRLVALLAPISYCVFLIQHIAINWLQIIFTKLLARFDISLNGTVCLALLIVTLAITLVAAWCLKFAADKVTPFLPFSILVKKENL